MFPIRNLIVLSFLFLLFSFDNEKDITGTLLNAKMIRTDSGFVVYGIRTGTSDDINRLTDSRLPGNMVGFFSIDTLNRKTMFMRTFKTTSGLAEIYYSYIFRSVIPSGATNYFLYPVAGQDFLIHQQMIPINFKTMVRLTKGEKGYKLQFDAW